MDSYKEYILVDDRDLDTNMVLIKIPSKTNISLIQQTIEQSKSIDLFDDKIAFIFQELDAIVKELPIINIG